MDQDEWFNRIMRKDEYTWLEVVPRDRSPIVFDDEWMYTCRRNKSWIRTIPNGHMQIGVFS
jgi:hypothetical protein